MPIADTMYRSQRAHMPNTPVVDLRNLAEPLLQYHDIAADLSQDQETRIIEYVKSAHTMAYRKLQRRYDAWLEADRAHDVYVRPDATEFREKAVIADTRAISDTVLTYMMAALTGRNPMFGLEGMNRESRKVALLNERVLHQQMRQLGGEAKIAQLILDTIRYGIAPTKIVWDNTLNANRITNFDPRRVFYDPRVNWGDWDRMQFCIFTDYFAYDALIATRQYPKLKRYPQLRYNHPNSERHGWEGHRHVREEGRGYSIDPQFAADSERADHQYFALGSARVIDECWIRLPGEALNLPGIESLWCVITIMDEDIVLSMRLSPAGQQFPVVMGGMYADRHKHYPQSLYDLLMPLHDISTWLMRSRVDNVQAALNNLIFVDPQMVSIPDLIDRNPWGIVRTLPGTKPGDGVHVEAIPDVTSGHWQDIDQLHALKQRVSAASDAQQGLPTPGVRTATEIQRLTQLGSQRLGVQSRIMSATVIRPMVRMMVSNIQDALKFDTQLPVDQAAFPSQLSDLVKDGYIDVDIQALQGDIQYLVIDGTLPLEPTRDAETWLNILQVMSQTGLNMEYRVNKIAEEAIRSMGVSDLDQFKISEEEAQQGPTPSQQMALLEKARGASVQPNENVQREVERGNLIPAAA